MHSQLICWALAAQTRKVRRLMQKLNDAVAAQEALAPQLIQAIADGRNADAQAAALADRITTVTASLQAALIPASAPQTPAEPTDVTGSDNVAA